MRQEIKQEINPKIKQEHEEHQEEVWSEDQMRDFQAFDDVQRDHLTSRCRKFRATAPAVTQWNACKKIFCLPEFDAAERTKVVNIIHDCWGVETASTGAELSLNDILDYAFDNSPEKILNSGFDRICTMPFSWKIWRGF